MPSAPKRIFLSPPHMSDVEHDYVSSAISSGWVAPLGPDVDRFEQHLCEFVHVSHAAALSSGTAGLHLALHTLGVGPGDRVYVPTLTFAASAFAVTYTGATPVFVDSENVSWNLDPVLLGEMLQADEDRGCLPAAIMTVDLFGRTCDYDRIMPLAALYNVPVVEDAAEALGAYHGFGPSAKAAGSFGVAGVFSFNGNKIMTTSGGGMVVSDDGEFVSRIRHLATQAREPADHYEHSEVGFNYRMSNILAALGCAQLSRLPEMVLRRKAINAAYVAEFSDVPGVQVLSDPPWGQFNGWLSTVRFDPTLYPAAPSRVRAALEKENIESRPVWKPMHAQPVFADSESKLSGVADGIFAQSLCLPSGSALTDEDVERIVFTVRTALLI